MKTGTIVSAIFFLITAPAFAFRLSPMVAEFEGAGAKATQTFLIDNSDKEKVAIQLEVTTRELDKSGKEVRTPNKDFLIFPEQISLEAGERRNVRVTYVGKQDLDREVPFRLIATQLPVDFKKPEVKNGTAVAVNFLLQYVASLYVGPDSAKAKMEVVSVKTNKAGQVEIELKNAGTKHKVLTGMNITVTSKSKTWKIEEGQLKDIRAENLLPGATRKFAFKAPTDFPKTEMHAEIKF